MDGVGIGLGVGVTFGPQPTGIPCSECGEEILAYNEVALEVIQRASDAVRKYLRCTKCHEAARRAADAAEAAGIADRARISIGYEIEGS